jgi:hypothetical protein
MLRTPRRRNRGDHARLRPEGQRVLAQQRVIARGTAHVELRSHFFLPLADQRRRRQDQDALDHAAQQIFFEHHTGFHRFAEADLIGQQDAPVKLFQHFAHRFDLIPVGLHAMQHRQAQQLIKTL